MKNLHISYIVILALHLMFGLIDLLVKPMQAPLVIAKIVTIAIALVIVTVLCFTDDDKNKSARFIELLLTVSTAAFCIAELATL